MVTAEGLTAYKCPKCGGAVHAAQLSDVEGSWLEYSCLACGANHDLDLLREYKRELKAALTRNNGNPTESPSTFGESAAVNLLPKDKFDAADGDQEMESPPAAPALREFTRRSNGNWSAAAREWLRTQQRTRPEIADLGIKLAARKLAGECNIAAGTLQVWLTAERQTGPAAGTRPGKRTVGFSRGSGSAVGENPSQGERQLSMDDLARLLDLLERVAGLPEPLQQVWLKGAGMQSMQCRCLAGRPE